MLKKHWKRLPDDGKEDKKMERRKRNFDFLKSILREKNAKRRRAKILTASKDQINSVSEMALNLIKRNIPVSPAVISLLRIYKDVIVN